MLCLNVARPEMNVKLHSFKVAMAEYLLNAERVTAVEERFLGKGVAENMRRASLATDTS